MYRKYRSRAWAERKFSFRRKGSLLATILISSAFSLYYAGAQVDNFSVSLSQPSLINTVTNLTNLIQNPSLETLGTGSNPEGWFRGGWGINNRIHTYPIVGIDGVRAARVQVTSYTNGDAKWYFKNVPVTPGKTYRLTHSYKANVQTQLLAAYQTSVGWKYTQLSLPAASANWVASNVTFTVPTNATSMTVFHLLPSIGTLDIDAFSLSVQETAAPAVNTPISLATPYPSVTPTVTPGFSFSLSPISGSPQVTPTSVVIPSYSPTPTPIPTPVATPSPYKQVVLNTVKWGYNALQNVPIKDISQANLFVLPVDANGNLLEGNPSQEAKFIADVHAQGKKVTLCIAGGTQNIAAIAAALTTGKTNLINNIAARLTQYGYDGVVLDVENTWIQPSVIPTFINQLRTKIGEKPIIGVYVQHWQKDTVYGQLQDSADAIDWIAPMIYDFSYTMDDLKSLTLAWLPRIKQDRSKLYAGVAVNYPTGLGVGQYKEVLQWVNAQQLGGVAVWQNNLFTQPWLDAQRSVWPVVK
jgi:hypothetical protein